jgi:hypothetical protein
MHGGGAPGSVAPRGNKNALKHGLYKREAIEERAATTNFDAAIAAADSRHRVIALAWQIAPRCHVLEQRALRSEHD